MNPASTIGIIGFGRFGSALAGLMQSHGHAWLGWDPAVPVASGHAVVDIDELLRRCGLIALAVPVDAFETALRDLRPRLNARHQVMDVCSVKQGPCRLMDAIFGDDIGHVGCHPLFGPLSIARAEPLRTVLCPSSGHRATADRVRALFESIGSEVREQDPESHDRYMALTHAMAFFIARGLLDLGLDDDLQWAPPSFAALAASIAAVRADAGHLFNAIQRQNPHAASTRQRLIEALSAIDQRLLQAPTSLDALATPGIPDLGRSSPVLREVRDHIADLDRELVSLLRRRRELGVRAAQAGDASGQPVTDAYETALLDERAEWARQDGLPVEAIQDVFRRIFLINRQLPV